VLVDLRSGLHPSYIGQIGRLMGIALVTAQSRTAPEARVRLRRTVSQSRTAPEARVRLRRTVSLP